MLFSSITFLYYFLPIVVLIYFLVPKFFKNPVLLLFSLAFYAWGEPKYVFLMIATILANYILGLLIDKFRGKFLSKFFLIVSIIASLSALGYFKYADFFIENFNRATGLSVKLLNIALPIGISFYTFQILSYTIDVYRGNVSVQKNPLTLGTYVALFPQLIAGPIVRYQDVERELKYRKHSFEKTTQGIKRFILGLSKKVLLANTIGQLCDVFRLSNDKSVAFFWLFAFAYMLQVYFDFSGYSDMAIGLGKIFGFEFMENFRYPFISSSISEFWRRWHISLGSWFRDYVYIPLGGNRVTKLRLLLNIFIVWFLTGFWHGAEWNFIVWGLYFGILLLLEKLFLTQYLKNSKILSHIYVLFFVAVSFVIFSASDMKEALRYLGGMFGFGNIPIISSEFLYNIRNYGFSLLIGALCATPLFVIIYEKLSQKRAFKICFDILEIPFLLILLLVVSGYFADGSFNPFLYFRF